MDLTKLSELIEIPKKSEASKEKKQDFLDEMMMLLVEEGYSATAEKCLCEGFSFCGTMPVAMYIKSKSIAERQEVINSIFSGSKYRSNEKGIAFKLAVSYLCQAINLFPEETKFIELLMRDVPIKSKNKEGKLHGDAARVIEKYFVAELDKNASLPQLADIELKPVFVLEFSQLIYDIIRDIKPSNSTPSWKIEKIKSWVNFTQGDEATIQTGSHATRQEELNASEVKTSAQNHSNKPLKAYELKSFAESLSTSFSRVIATAAYITSLEKGMNTLKTKLDNSTIELESHRREIAAVSAALEQKKAEYEKLDSERSMLAYEVASLKKEISIRDSNVNELMTEIEKQNSVLSVYSVDKQNAQSEQLNAIASKLKAEYLDFKDAKDIDMTVDLGENLRQQISSIFKILAKNGIDVGRR